MEAMLVIAFVFGVYQFQKISEARERNALSEDELNRRFSKTITYQGQEYPLKRGVSTVLLIGTDNYIDDSKQNEYEAFYNRNQADFLVILAFDHSNRTVTPVQICRDTICDVPWLTVNGLVGGTERTQITLAHTYGSGKEDSCVNTRNAMENLLYGLPIDRYLAFSMETVPLVNDLVGGVKVTLEEDIPALGKDYVKGNEILLKGKAALRFVRYRDTSLLDDNLRRMAHHRKYLESFTDTARNAVSEDSELIEKGIKTVQKYLCTDLSVENLSDMIHQLCDYEILPVISPTGKYVSGDPFPEFHMDDESLWKCVSDTFCQ